MVSTTTPEAVSDYERARGKPMPSLNHSIVQLRLGSLFMARYDDQYTITSELSLALNPPTTPDICIYPKLDIDWMHDRIHMEKLPLLAIEIALPTQSVQDMGDRIQQYLAAGIQSVWRVESVLQLIAIYTPDTDPHVISEGEVVDPATGIRVTIEEIFR